VLTVGSHGLLYMMIGTMKMVLAGVGTLALLNLNSGKESLVIVNGILQKLTEYLVLEVMMKEKKFIAETAMF